jgi:hypothetical protein
MKVFRRGSGVDMTGGSQHIPTVLDCIQVNEALRSCKFPLLFFLVHYIRLICSASPADVMNGRTSTTRSNKSLVRAQHLKKYGMPPMAWIWSAFVNLVPRTELHTWNLPVMLLFPKYWIGGGKAVCFRCRLTLVASQLVPKRCLLSFYPMYLMESRSRPPIPLYVK